LLRPPCKWSAIPVGSCLTFPAPSSAWDCSSTLAALSTASLIGGPSDEQEQSAKISPPHRRRTRGGIFRLEHAASARCRRGLQLPRVRALSRHCRGALQASGHGGTLQSNGDYPSP